MMGVPILLYPGCERRWPDPRADGAYCWLFICGLCPDAGQTPTPPGYRPHRATGSWKRYGMTQVNMATSITPHDGDRRAGTVACPAGCGAEGLDAERAPTCARGEVMGLIGICAVAPNVFQGLLGTCRTRPPKELRPDGFSSPAILAVQFRRPAMSHCRRARNMIILGRVQHSTPRRSRRRLGRGARRAGKRRGQAPVIPIWASAGGVLGGPNRVRRSTPMQFWRAVAPQFGPVQAARHVALVDALPRNTHGQRARKAGAARPGSRRCYTRPGRG